MKENNINTKEIIEYIEYTYNIKLNFYQKIILKLYAIIDRGNMLYYFPRLLRQGITAERYINYCLDKELSRGR